MMNGEQYIESLRRLKTEIYYAGERIAGPVTDHPAILPHVRSAAMTYDLAHRPEFEDLLTATSHLTGRKINRFTHIHQSAADLVKKVKMLRALAQQTGSCFQRCVGFDALNAAYTVTYEMDSEMGTGYHARLQNFIRHVQENDFMVAGSMTDPKGDRGLRPSQQADPDLYTRVVERRADGIVIRGAKAHQTGIVNSHWMLILPTVALTEEDKDYAVTCAVPVDAPGVIHIFGRQTNDERRLQGSIDQGNERFSVVGGEALTVLEDVFVPWEMVFMCGEYKFAGALVERFASYHRQNYGGCKGGVSDVLLGAAALAAEYNGAIKASHVRDKLAEMTLLTETLFSGSLACSHEGRKTPSGAYYVDPLLANVVKHNCTRMIYEIARLAHDLAGGIVATMPHEKDLKSPRTGPLIEKYLKGVSSVPTENRIRIMRLIENMTSCTALAESMHGAGSPQAQRVMLTRQGNIERKKQLAMKIAGIRE
jgi:4-hydroxybutyryl-CoA dehydratase/vinylacetyl-CoA-Delta-isomerase